MRKKLKGWMGQTLGLPVLLVISLGIPLVGKAYPSGSSSGSATVRNPNRIVAVSAGANSTANGTALLAAYQTAVEMSPAISNEVTLLLDPGVFDLGTNVLTITNMYVNFVGQVPVTMTVQGPVAVGGYTNVSAVLTEKQPMSIIKGAVDHYADNGFVKYIKFEGLVKTYGRASYWEDCWFDSPFDLWTVEADKDTAAVFNRVYAPNGICANESVDGCSFSGKITDSVIGTNGMPYYILGGYYGSCTGTIKGSTIRGASGTIVGQYSAFYGVIDGCTIVTPGDALGASTIGLIQNSLISAPYSIGYDGGSGGVFGGTLKNCIVLGGDTVCSSGDFIGIIDGCTFVGNSIIGYSALNACSGTIKDSTIISSNGIGYGASTFSAKIINCDVYGDGNVNPSLADGAFISNCRFYGNGNFGDMTNSVIQYTSGLTTEVTNQPITISFCTLTNNVVITNK